MTVRQGLPLLLGASPVVLLVGSHGSDLISCAPGLIDEGFTVHQAEDDREAIDFVRRTPPDAVVIGRLSGSLDRAELCHALRRIVSAQGMTILPVLRESLRLLRIHCLEQGADDYMVEPVSAGALASRIRTLVGSREIRKSVSMLHYGGLTMDVEKFKLFHKGRMIPLRPMIFQLLRAFLEHPEKILSGDELMRIAGWHRTKVPDTAIASYIRTLRASLAVAGMAHLIQTVRSQGYMMKDGCRDSASLDRDD